MDRSEFDDMIDDMTHAVVKSAEGHGITLTERGVDRINDLLCSEFADVLDED